MNAPSPDPLLDLVTAYFKALDDLTNAVFRGCEREDEFVDTFCLERIDPLRDRIISGDLIASTKAGAAAALRLAERQDQEGDEELTVPLMAAVRGFLEGSAA